MRRVMLLRGLVLAAALVGAAPVRAVTPDEILPDPQLEARARALSHELRCMVCQNQSIDDSDAPLAHDLRVLVRDRLKAGDNDTQVLDLLVPRYGEFVLLKPPLELRTLLLWGLPPLALVAGLAGLVVAMRRRKAASTEPDELSAAEQCRLASFVEPRAD